MKNDLFRMITKKPGLVGLQLVSSGLIRCQNWLSQSHVLLLNRCSSFTANQQPIKLCLGTEISQLAEKDDLGLEPSLKFFGKLLHSPIHLVC